MNEADGLLKAETSDKKRLKAIAASLDEMLNLVKTLGEEIIENCAVEEVEAEIEESDEINSRVIDRLLVINEATGSMDNNDGLSVVQQRISTILRPLVLNNRLRLLDQVELRLWLLKIMFNSNCPGVQLMVDFILLTSLQLPTLRTCNHEEIQGQAARGIQGLTRTEANYRSAIEILHKRFGRVQNIILTHMDEMLKIPACINDKASQLRLGYDKISINIRGLESLGVSSHQYGSLLIPVIMSKLPHEMRIQVARNTARVVWEMSDLLEVIRQEVEAREIREGVRTNVSLEKLHPNHHKTPTANALLSQDGTRFSSTGNQIKYVYCGGLHYSASCENNSREGQNSTLVSHTREPITNKIDHVTKPEEGNETPSLGSTVTATSTARAKGGILLQTAAAIATNEDRSKSITVQILFDNGSQRSYVTDFIKAKLGLTATSSETLHLNTFGENAYRTQKCQVVTLPLRSNKDQYVEISALNFPVICSPLPKRIDVTKYPHLIDLDLADRSAIDLDSIDILIGTDYYWDIVTGESIRGEFGPTAINSKFGWLLSGPTEEQHVHEISNVVSNLIISEDDESYAKLSTTPRSSEVKNDTIVKVLGLNWDTASDEFFFDLTELYKYGSSLPATKRSVLKLTAKIFDPIGFLTPFNAAMKILFQELCLKKIDWDSDLKGSLLITWNTLLEELKCLSNREDHKSTPQTYVTQFGLDLQEGVVRCKGRLNNSPVPKNSRKPILLPASHEFVQLLVKQSDESAQHSGIRDTLTTLRERFWVLRGREAVKKFIRKCVTCRKYEGMPYSSLPSNDLPDKRVSEDPPFTHVGLDFVGPLFIETKSPEVERNESK
ncbi:hypothetical protein AWC38_SpisGene24962, partial [Stylophora pistillata]